VQDAAEVLLVCKSRMALMDKVMERVNRSTPTRSGDIALPIVRPAQLSCLGERLDEGMRRLRIE